METTKSNSPSLYINDQSPHKYRRDSIDSDDERTIEDDYADKGKVNRKKDSGICFFCMNI